jgi:hypothetical protein
MSEKDLVQCWICDKVVDPDSEKVWYALPRNKDGEHGGMATCDSCWAPKYIREDGPLESDDLR